MGNTRYCLTKAELADAVFAAIDSLEKRQSVELVEDFIELFKEALERDERVMLSRFGRFTVRHKAPRRGINPQTKETLTLEGRSVVRFKASPLLVNVVNGAPVEDGEGDE